MSFLSFIFSSEKFFGLFFFFFPLWKAMCFHEELNCAENPPKENFGKKNTAWNLLTFRKSPGPSIRTGPVGKCCREVNADMVGLPKHCLGCFLQGWVGTILATAPGLKGTNLLGFFTFISSPLGIPGEGGCGLDRFPLMPISCSWARFRHLGVPLWAVPSRQLFSISQGGVEAGTNF